MKRYIDKDALLARIKKIKMDIGNIFNEYDEGFWEGRTTAFDDVICALDTLKVKEVDLEKEFDEYTKNIWAQDIKEEPFTQLFKCAKHFFELGIQQSNHN